MVAGGGASVIYSDTVVFSFNVEVYAVLQMSPTACISMSSISGGIDIMAGIIAAWNIVTVTNICAGIIM